jgi:hypothetical protein
MIKRHHVVADFFAQAEAMRGSLDARFRDAYRDSISWFYFCDPRMYTYLRASPASVFPRELLADFAQRLRSWCIESLGLAPIGMPFLHLMVNGCRLGLHSDFHNGVWGYVYSLTRWHERKFSGGETLLLRDGVPSYKRHHVHGEVLYELVPAHFNQLLVFDDRLVHATPAIEGSMDPLDARIALVGHIRAMSPVVAGPLPPAQARRLILDALHGLREQIRSYKDVQGTFSCRLAVAATGAVETVTVLTDNLVTAQSGYDHSEAVARVRAMLQQMLSRLRFPAAGSASTIVVSVLVPLPDLRPMQFAVAHAANRDELREWIGKHLGTSGHLDLEGDWDADTLQVREPVAGTLRIGAREIAFEFDAPMWVPSQRERFETSMAQWIRTAPGIVQ